MLRSRPSKGREIPVFIDTPAGMVTPGGVHFTTTRELLEEYAGRVLEKVSVDQLVSRAEVWLRSSQSLALWGLAVLLPVAPPLVAAALSIMIYLVWEVMSLVLASRRLVSVFRVLEQPLVQGVLFVAVLSILGARGDLASVAVGLIGFIGFRWQLIPILLRPFVRLVRRPISSLPPPDQVLRAFVLRAALRHEIALPQLKEFRDRMRR